MIKKYISLSLHFKKQLVNSGLFFPITKSFSDWHSMYHLLSTSSVFTLFLLTGLFSFAQTIPYNEDFSGTNSFTFINGSETNQWVYGAAAGNTGNSIYVSNDLGVTNTYSVTNASVTQAFRDITIPIGTTFTRFSFDWKANGEAANDYLRVWLVPSSFAPTAGSQINAASDRIQIGADFNQQTTWQTFSDGNLDLSSFANTTMRLVFEWSNNASGGSNAPAAIDNISLSIPSCLPPTALTASMITSSAATLNWTASTSIPFNGYDVYVSTINTVPTISTIAVGSVSGGVTTFNFVGASSFTTYYFWVRSNCGGSDFSEWFSGGSFKTVQVPTMIPYNQDFSGITGFTFVNGSQENKWVNGSATGNSGNSIYISNDAGLTNNYNVVSASITHAFRDITVPFGTSLASFSFDWKANGEAANDYLRVWLVPTAFIPTAGIQITAASNRIRLGTEFNQQTTWQTFSDGNLDLSSFANTTMRLVFEWTNNNSLGTQTPAAIDNISLTTCLPPSALIANVSSSSSATISWTENVVTPADGHQYYYSTSSTSPTAITTPTGSTASGVLTANLTGLSANTLYYFWVRSNCGTSSKSIWVFGGSFTTTPLPATLPYNQDFNGVNDFYFVNGTQENKWISGSATGNSGNSIYISNDTSSTNAYNVVSASVTHAFRDIGIPNGTTLTSFSFDWKANGEAANDYLRVWLVSASFTPTSGSQITVGSGRIQVGGNYNQQTTWQTYTNGVLNLSSFANTTMRLVFEWVNNALDGTQTPAAIDNISLEIPNCLPPISLTSSSITSSTATISWAASASAPVSGYQYYVSTAAIAPTAGTAPTGITGVGVGFANLSSLPSDTQHYFWVRSDCGGSDTSIWVPGGVFATTQVLATLPYTEDFSGTNSFSFVNGSQVNQWVNGAATGNPANSLYISNNAGVANDYTLTAASTTHAYRDIEIPTGTTLTTFSFDWKANGESTFDYLRVWLVPSIFTPAAGSQITVGSGRIQVGGNYNQQTAWQTYSNVVLDLSSFANTSMRLIFEWRNDGAVGSQTPAAIDNISLIIPNCLPPIGLIANTLTTSSATLNWTASTSSPSSGYDLYYSLTNTAPAAGSTPTVNNHPTSPYAVTGLTSATTYYWWVRSDCSADVSGWNFGGKFKTIPNCGESFSDSGDNLGEYGNDENTTTVITPTTSGNYATVVFSSFDTEANYDYLKVYNGPNASSPALHIGNGFNGNLAGNLPGPFISTDASGALTFVFTSDVSVTRSGWNASITCAPACAGTPDAGVTVLSAPDGCIGNPITLTALGVSLLSGVSFQWESSPDNATWTNVIGGTTLNYTLTPPSTLYYRLKSTCANGGATSVSSSSLYTVYSCVFIPASGSNSVVCGTNIVLKDHAGDADYNNNVDGFTVLNAAATSVININGSYGTESGNDLIRIYNGSGFGGTLLSTFSGSGTFNYTGTVGQTLTVRFSSNGNLTNSGLKLNVNYTGLCVADYHAEIQSVDYGSSDWCAGESRTVTATIKNVGIVAWTNTTPDINIGLKWNTDGTNWTNYHVKTDANGLAPGATGTFTFTMQAANNIGAGFTSALAGDSNNLHLDIENSGSCWFGTNSGTCGPGNTVFVSPAINIVAIPSDPSPVIASPTNVCVGQTSSLNAVSAGNTIRWWDAATGGVLLATTNSANNYAVTPPNSKTYYAESVTAIGACPSQNRVSAVVNVIASNPVSVASATGATLVSGDLLWSGNSTTLWGTMFNWYAYNGSAFVVSTSAPTSTSRVFILPSSTAGICTSPTNNTTVTASGVASDVFIVAGATMNIDAAQSLVVKGNWTNNGTFTPNATSTVTFDGATNQSIGGSTTTSFSSLIINKPTGTLTLNAPTIVTGTLTMTNGDIQTTATNSLTVGTSAVSPGSLDWTNGTVLGPIKRYFSGTANASQASGIFPVGLSNKNRYAQVNYTSGLSTGGFITAEYVAGGCPVGYAGLPNTINGELVQNYENEGYWSIVPDGGNLNSATYSLILRGKSLTTVQPAYLPRLRMIKSISHTSWDNIGLGAHNAPVGNETDFTITNTGMTGFSFFNIGSNNSSPLPIKLISFTASCDDNANVALEWKTASEQNSLEFILERSRDLNSWEAFATVAAAGNSNQLIQYSHTDLDAMGGTSYYRLVQRDFNGTEEVYGPISVNCNANENALTVYPNPTQNNFTLEISSLNIEKGVGIQLTDLTGKVIETRTIDLEVGNNQFYFSKNLESGVYLIRVSDKGAKYKTLKLEVRN
jgi:hypothetical protein